MICCTVLWYVVLCWQSKFRGPLPVLVKVWELEKADYQNPEKCTARSEITSWLQLTCKPNYWKINILSPPPEVHRVSSQLRLSLDFETYPSIQRSHRTTPNPPYSLWATAVTIWSHKYPQLIDWAPLKLKLLWRNFDVSVHVLFHLLIFKYILPLKLLCLLLQRGLPEWGGS